MKVYQFKYQEILLNETVLNEELLLDGYRDQLLNLLTRHNISNKKIFEVISLNTYRITSNPLTVSSLLKNNVLPAFVFLSCSNWFLCKKSQVMITSTIKHHAIANNFFWIIPARLVFTVCYLLNTNSEYQQHTQKLHQFFINIKI